MLYAVQIHKSQMYAYIFLSVCIVNIILKYSCVTDFWKGYDILSFFCFFEFW